MLYQSEEEIKKLGINWEESISVIQEAVYCLHKEDYSQPIKPYLRYRDRQNRIIAMPAFVGGSINMAGIKWISSFPKNIQNNLPRAHSVIILNEADTGIPIAVINTPLLSIIRTASVSGLIIQKSPRHRERDNIKIGITGFGPIGQYHLNMCTSLLGDKIREICIYDIREQDDEQLKDIPRARFVKSWEEAYTDADIFMTCTVSDKPYITDPPKPGSLHLNVSLRDYSTAAFDWFKGAIIVDDWDEVCRQKTDIEMMHLEKGLQKEDTKSIVDVVSDNCLMKFPAEQAVMFNPMGMAVFDIAIAKYYVELARKPVLEL